MPLIFTWLHDLSTYSQFCFIYYFSPTPPPSFSSLALGKSKASLYFSYKYVGMNF